MDDATTQMAPKLYIIPKINENFPTILCYSFTVKKKNVYNNLKKERSLHGVEHFIIGRFLVNENGEEEEESDRKKGQEKEFFNETKKAKRKRKV